MYWQKRPRRKRSTISKENERNKSLTHSKFLQKNKKIKETISELFTDAGFVGFSEAALLLTLDFTCWICETLDLLFAASRSPGEAEGDLISEEETL